MGKMKKFLLLLCCTPTSAWISREPGVINPLLDTGFSKTNMNPFIKARCTAEFLNERSHKSRG